MGTLYAPTKGAIAGFGCLAKGPVACAICVAVLGVFRGPRIGDGARQQPLKGVGRDQRDYTQKWGTSVLGESRSTCLEASASY